MSVLNKQVLVPNLITLSCCLALGWIAVGALTTRPTTPSAVSYSIPGASAGDRREAAPQQRETQSDRDQASKRADNHRVELWTPFGRIEYRWNELSETPVSVR